MFVSFWKKHLVWLLLVGVIFIRLLWHSFAPIGLSGDETYYWDWSRRLAWGYFSKPPGIAWLNAMLGWLSGQTAFGIKAGAAVLATASGYFLFRAVRQIANEKIAMATLLVVLVSPGNLLLGAFLTTDAPLVFCWNLGLWMAARITMEQRAPRYVFVVLWLALGLGALFKQMMLVQIVLLWFGCGWLRRDVIRRWELSAASLGSLLFLLPTLWWNQSNNWITVEHTAHHFESARLTVGAFFSRLGSLYGATALLLSPVLFVLCLSALWRVTARLREAAIGEKFFWLWGALPFLVMSIMTLWQEVNPNWPAVYFSSLAALCAMVWMPRQLLWMRALLVGAGLSLVMMCLPFFMETFYEMKWLKPQRRGWEGYDALAKVVDTYRQENDAVVALGHRFCASQLAFHLRGQPFVWLWNEKPQILSQYDLWPKLPQDRDALIVLEQSNPKQPAILPKAFSEAELLVSTPLHPARTEHQFLLYRLRRAKNIHIADDISHP